MFDRIIVSADDKSFDQFWPIVAKAWNKFFPEVKVTLAFVTNKSENDEYVKKLREFGEVVLFKLVEGVPTGNQAKMARHYLAGTFGKEICMIEDIDTIPLQAKFVVDIIRQRQKNKLLTVGMEVYDNSPSQGKFPISNISAESFIFKEIINPNNLTFQEMVKEWMDIRVFDHKEAINNSPDTFSDESLLRVLIKKWNPEENKINKVKRGVNIYSDWIDRSWWNIDIDKLQREEYVTCNFLRPLDKYFDQIKPVADFIYGRSVDKNELIIN